MTAAEIIVRARAPGGTSGTLTLAGRQMTCALGRGGIRRHKREGDGATPAGSFLLRKVLYRPDREAAPATALPVAPLSPADGWCDDPGDLQYNRQVGLPYPGRCETLWREEGIYDLIAVIGHNDGPVQPGGGSAIFLHLARPGFTPTEGCVALAREDLLAVLAASGAETRLKIIP